MSIFLTSQPLRFPNIFTRLISNSIASLAPIKTDNAPNTIYVSPGRTYSYATIAPANAKMVYVSGINARGENGKVLSLETQLVQIFKKLDEILKQAGSKPECITMIKQYTTRMDDSFFDLFLTERGKFLQGSKPASALIPMPKLTDNGIDIEIELVAYQCD